MISSDIALYLHVACKQKAMDVEDENIGYAFVGAFGLSIVCLVSYVVYKIRCERRDPLDYELIPSEVLT